MTLTPALPAFSRLAMRRHAVRSGCAMALALALIANPGTVSAQSFLGNGVAVDGGANITHGTGTTDITVVAPQAIINWTLPSSPAAGNPPEVFQPVGTTATFIAGTSGSFTVLNRILPTDGGGAAVNRPAQFNGTVNGPPNGSIWFYSPSGIVIGSTATFNVGSLVLTSNDIVTTDGLYGTNGEIRFRGPASSLAPVEIQAGAAINAGELGQGNYLAIVAPRIVQAGTISANGQVALIAAEQADIRMNAGLLDIVVTQGTTDPNGIIHTGNTGGPASATSDDRQVLSLIAMPKNTALTMLLSGSIGYTPAASAQDEGSSVVLSAGHASYLSNAELDQHLGSIAIGNSQFLSPVTALATNAIDIAPNGGTVEFGQVASFNAFRSVSAIAGEGESIISGDSLFLRAIQGTTGGSATVRAEAGGAITTVRGLFISANAASESSFFETGDGVAATAGTVTLTAAGGSISAGEIVLGATGYGLAGEQIGGNGTGGSITASVSAGGSITTANFSASADGYGGFAGNAQQYGGDGFGGTISLLDQGGTLDLGEVSLIANGTGGQAIEQTGNATGGSVLVDIATGTKNWTGLSIEANARGGQGYYYGGVAGNATARADAIRLHVGSGAVLNIADSAYLTAYAYADINGSGNTGVGGGISVLVDGGGTLRVGDVLNIGADALVPNESQFYGPQTSPTLTGGTVNVLATGGVIEAHAFQASASASGIGASEAAGTATGGTVTVGAANGGTIRTLAAAGDPGSLIIEANAYGGSGTAPSNALGGTATLFVSDGTLDINGDIQISASAQSAPFGGDAPSGAGFTARGGTASLELRAGTTGSASLNAAGISVVADGNAAGMTEGGLDGDGGAGTGGTARLSVAAGTLTTGTAAIRADGFGGRSGAWDGSTPFQSGNGFGGTATLVTTGGSTSTASFQLLARGTGGDGSIVFGGETAPLSGNGTGGNVSTQLSGGSITTQTLVLDASGNGGHGSDDFSGGLASAGSNGGDGTGGTAQLGMAAGSAALLTAGTVQVVADGLGGAGGQLETGGTGNGGNGSGGRAGFNLADGSFTLGATTVQANGVGSSGTTGGNGVGGVASFLLNDSQGGTTQRSIATLSLYGRGIAGTSEGGPAATETAGQTQLVANAGSPARAVTVSGDFLAEATGAIAPAGNGFTANVGGAAFNVGGSTTITTSRDVSMTIAAGGALATQGALTIATPRGVASTGLVSAAGGAMITADLGIAMTDLQSGATTRLSAMGGPITVSNDLSSAGLVTLIGPAANIRSQGALALGDISGSGDFSVNAAGDLATATLAMTGNVTLSSGGTLRIGGRIIGTNITAASGDIVIGPNGSIGQRGITQSITVLNSNAASPTFIGGTPQQGGYSLDAAEAARLFADNSITLGLPANAAPTAANLVIGDLALSYGANGSIGTGGILKINAPGRIQVNGQVALTTTSSADRFAIDPTRIEINTDTGGIAMLDANGGLQGQLELVGGTIVVASGATLAAIANLSNPMDINAALDAAPANPNDAGYIRAGSITLNATDAIYIANTGVSTANADRRGFTANSLNIITASPATHVSINGVLVDSSGAPVTGQDTLSLITVNAAPGTIRGLFSRFSTVNGCVLGAQSCNASLTTDMVKTKSDIEVPLDPEASRPQFTYVLEIEEREADDQQPLVDEPVTGVGNDDLWNGACGSNPGACPQGGNSQ